MKAGLVSLGVVPFDLREATFLVKILLEALRDWIPETLHRGAEQWGVSVRGRAVSCPFNGWRL